MSPVLLALACAAAPDSTPTEETSTPFVPAAGDWSVTFAQTFTGDCALDNMATQQPPSSTWVIEAEPVGFTLYDETGYPSGCTLDDAQGFACPDGTYTVSYAESGYDAEEAVTSGVYGTFLDATDLTAELDITAECSGADCGEVGTQYGASFSYPCTAIASFTAIWAGG